MLRSSRAITEVALVKAPHVSILEYLLLLNQTVSSTNSSQC